MLPAPGIRINLHGNIGTVRFVGPVDNTTGTWLGVEWDDPHRGKHDGVRNNQRYFACRIPNAGSFIRPSANISYGRSFLDALISKYVEMPHGSESQEKVFLGSSQGAIEVEAVRLDKIRAKLSNLEGLREVSLDKEDVSKPDYPGHIQNSCPNVRGLDLSMSLISTWDDIAAITRELTLLQTLALNRNRLQQPSSLELLKTAFPSLTVLQLNGTLTTWQESLFVISTMPNLQVLEMGYNHLSHLSQESDNPVSDIPAIQTVNLDHNICNDWPRVFASLKQLTSLQHVVLTSNQIRTIPCPAPGQQCPNLKHVSLSNNLLFSWSDIDNLSLWFPTLEILTLSGNPMADDSNLEKYIRPFTIAKIPSLLRLDGASVSSRERNDSEVFYLSFIAQHGPSTEAERCQVHPRWQDLCKRHGMPDESPKREDIQKDKLSNRLIDLNIYRCYESPLNNRIEELMLTEANILRVLPTMPLRGLRKKLSKMAQSSLQDTLVVLWLRMDGQTIVEIKPDVDFRDLSWLGVENGSQLLYLIKAK